MDQIFANIPTRWRRRTTVLRVAVIFLLGVCYLLFFSGSSPEIHETKKLTPSPPREGSASTLSRLGLHPGSLGKTRPQNGSPLKKPPRTHDQDLPKGSSHDVTQSIGEARDSDIANFKSALKQIYTLIPNEDLAEDLLLPLRGTGTQKLRDVGSRSRAFKNYFQAWEDLHLHVTTKTAHTRDNTIQLIRDHHDKLGLQDITLAQALRSYETFRAFITSLGDLLFPWTAPYFPDHMALHASFYNAGRGIVLSAGTEQVPFLLASIPSLRKLGCTLPIEVMYLGDEDISEELREDLEMLPGVITRDVKQMVRDAGWELAGWAVKPFAILLSSFQEVIFIDADAVFFTNPQLLFEDPQYVETGALFFKDRSLFPESKRKWLKQILPKPISKSARATRLWTGESGHMQESGVLVVDKWRHFVELLLVTRMNGPDRDGDEDNDLVGIYDMVYGDKETFWLSWELLGNSDYAFHNGSRGSMGTVHYGPIQLETEDEASKADLENKTIVHKTGGEDARYRGATSELKKEKPNNNGQKHKSSVVADGTASVKSSTTASTKSADRQTLPTHTPKKDSPIKDSNRRGPGEPSGPVVEKQATLAADTELIENERDDSADDDDDDDNDEAPLKDSTKSGSKAPSKPTTKATIKTPPNARSKRSVLPPKEVPTNYTICAPQLLHMDGQGRPLWFNGWLARNKYKDPAHSEAGVFEVYNREPDRASQSDAWQLGESNMVCLTSDRVMTFTAAERAHLESVVESARARGALGKKQKEQKKMNGPV
ncbi:hypothetical protein MBLNU459_g0198t1 [Dothideomycetes sp. NU459]